jgi:hypothetical protein
MELLSVSMRVLACCREEQHPHPDDLRLLLSTAKKTKDVEDVCTFASQTAAREIMRLKSDRAKKAAHRGSKG